MRLDKRGSMELGVNAIVILIIALAILGLGIAFITNLFRGGSDKLGKIIDNTELPVHADAVNPIAFETSQLTVKQGKRENIKISVYNDAFSQSTPITLKLSPDGCTPASDPMLRDFDTGGPITLAAPSQEIPPGKDSGFLAVISAPAELEPDTYICTVEAEGDNGKRSSQIIIEVVL